LLSYKEQDFELPTAFSPAKKAFFACFDRQRIFVKGSGKSSSRQRETQQFLSWCVWGIILFPPTIVSNSSTDELFQSRLINRVALMEIDHSRFFCIKASIEERMRIFQGSALKKVHFDGLLESADSTHKSLVRPDGCFPLPFLSEMGISLENQFAQSGDHGATPVRKLCDVLIDVFGWIHVLLLEETVL
jgi:hypothetical protein